ncbi:hypothetical protein ACFL1H_03535 [Nanoarchaeota archaeon]
MTDGLTFYAIKKEDLDKLAEGPKQFVEDFFKEKNIFGLECLVAIESPKKSPWHQADDEDYEKGLTNEEKEDCGIFTYISNNPLFFEYYWS